MTTVVILIARPGIFFVTELYKKWTDMMYKGEYCRLNEHLRYGLAVGLNAAETTFQSVSLRYELFQIFVSKQAIDKPSNAKLRINLEKYERQIDNPFTFQCLSFMFPT